MQGKNYTGGKRSSPKAANSGLKKPTYTGANRARSSSGHGSQAAPYSQGQSSSGGAKDSSKGYPGSGSMPSGSAAGHESYPTSESGVTTRGGHQHTTTGSSVRSSRLGM
jgi:hypothetical protein